MAFAIKGKITGLEAALKKVAKVADAVKGRILRKAYATASVPMTKAAKNLAPVESKTLKKSIGRKIKTYKGGVVVVIIGPRTGQKVKVQIKGDRVYRMVNGQRVKIENPTPDMLEMLRNPTKYAHLMEFGSSKNAAKPFLRPAFQQHKTQFVEVAARIILEEIEKEARKA